MQDFLVKEITGEYIFEELNNIGFDSSYVVAAVHKFKYKNLKIYSLSCEQANIIKQTALSVGADCATHRQVITGKIDKSDCILTGSVSQLSKIAEKLKKQPFKLKSLAKIIEEKINYKECSYTKIMGVLNITSDSFSDGGLYYEDKDAQEHFIELINDGADIVDIGAESTRPFSHPISDEDQLNKLIPILEFVKQNNIRVPISVDTRSSNVAKRCIELGANIINDVSGFDYDEEMPKIIAKYPDVKVIIQHSKGTPENMQISPQYDNLMDEIYESLNNKVEFAVSQGIKKDNIIIDAGIGFGKTKEDNIQIIKRWRELKTIGCPVLLGLSRKSFLNVSGNDNELKDLYTLALDSVLMCQNIDYIRVHNVKIHKYLKDMIA